MLFSSPMVRAILAGTKSQTRRLVDVPASFRRPGFSVTRQDELFFDSPQPGVESGRIVRVPYHVGDRLWVRETWGFLHHVRHDFRPLLGRFDLSGSDMLTKVRYRASHTDDMVGRWRPSIHMPRWASRITLEITGVRVQRLQDISEADAKAEGVERIVVEDDSPLDAHVTGYFPQRASYAGSFSVLWDEINAKRAPWSSNPWVWAIEFKRVEAATEAA